MSLRRKRDIVTLLKKVSNARIFVCGSDAGAGEVFDFVDGGPGLTSLADFDWQGGWR